MLWTCSNAVSFIISLAKSGYLFHTHCYKLTSTKVTYCNTMQIVNLAYHALLFCEPEISTNTWQNQHGWSQMQRKKSNTQTATHRSSAAY